jgi:hypothetical protein
VHKKRIRQFNFVDFGTTNTLKDWRLAFLDWFDWARGYDFGNKHFDLEYIEEALTSSNWTVRIYSEATGQ